MRSTFVAAALALAVPAVYAQLDNFPDCALGCLTTNVGASGCENPLSNLGCVCQSDAFVKGARKCFATKCSQEDGETAVRAAWALCQFYTVTIETNLPEPTPTETSEPTTTVVETTTVTEEPEPTTTVVTETTTDVITTEYTTVFTSTIASTGTITPPTNTSNPTVPPPTNSDSAAAQNVAGLGAMLMAVAAVFAL